MDLESIIGLMVGLILGAAGFGGFLYATRMTAKKQADDLIEAGRKKAEDLQREADLQAKETLLAKKTELEDLRNKTQNELRREREELSQREQQLKQQGDGLRKQEKMVEASQRRLTEKLERNVKREKDLEDLLGQQRQQLHQITGLSREEATTRLLSLLESDLNSEIGTRLLRHERSLSEQLEQKSRDMLLVALQRYAASQTAEATTASVDIPSDEMKGRIIGREGRNIRSFEKETGVDLIIDDTPGVVIVSGFDPVRREVARMALGKLIADGRIHPTRIEEIVRETEKEIRKVIRRKGVEAADEVGVVGLHEKIIDYLGRLHFRTSYSQNVLRHSIEVAFIAGLLAEMVGLDEQLARRCGLLHDLGKAADHELEGGHPKIGADLLKRHGEGPDVVHAAYGHHDEIITEYPYTVLVATADACSASRPGARRESLERYIRRMEELESIAREFPGVQQAFAIQAGREMRVIVSAEEADDKIAAKICRDIANSFEQRLTYPGEIKVTVIREARFSEFAR
jgi:ribonuclease Y